MAESYHSKSPEDVLRLLNTTKKGLSDTEIENRLIKYGKNEIKHEEKINPVKLFLEQFKSFIVGILLAAVIISLVIGEHLDAAVIGIILILNAILGFIQEYKAEKSIEALKKLTSLKAVVIRKGEKKKIDASEIVPGDILVLETGEKIPADARLLETINLETQEAALTGESVPVKKIIEKVAEKRGVADRKDMIFSGTIITKGRGQAVVTATGMNTEIGKIAKMIQTSKVQLTPLQIKLKQLGEYLGAATIAIVILVFLIGILTGKPALEMFIIALSLAVAAIPEGLPAVVTISLALGIQRMIKRNALIRKLPSVETLGSTTVICTDKTGTLTHNQMTVRKIFANNKVIEVTGAGYKTEGVFTIDNKVTDPKEFDMLLKIGALCNDAKLTDNDVIGDPTEGALIVSAAKAKLRKKELERSSPRLAELQFDSERKRMSTFHHIEGHNLVLTKGAPDVIVNLCDRVMINGKLHRLTKEYKKVILKQNEEFAKQALRVLGFAYKLSNKLEEKNLIFVGLQAMIDPPREEVKEAIKKCNTAGIKVVMVTGDFKVTAEAIGKELGLTGKAIDGEELDKIKDLSKVVGDISIYARVDPKDKIRIVEALQKKGHVVAMTGDGVNDAPALKKAEIGVSMGITGTDVAKEASEMILTDDNFSSIVNAVEEGRGIYDNIKKFVNYLLSSNFGEVLILFIAILLGWPLPLIAVQILWINLVTDGLPALALGVDPISKDVMNKPPRKKKSHIISMNMTLNILIIGVLICAGTLGMFWYGLKTYDETTARTIAFSTIVVLELVRLYMIRANYNLGPFSNKWLVLAVASSILLQVLVVYTPLNTMVFKTVPLKAIEWLYMALVAIVLLGLGMLVNKLIIRTTHEKD
ncbi:calcium-translocating P-type ATPase, SERCA-type [Candidatus Woesearchaeota archaeon]|nr:calcium-translocating P-type ATPase, SERCA-type [Candidatus Woesearchaeota archaeon]